MNLIPSRTATRTSSRIILGAFGVLAVAGLLTSAKAEVQPVKKQETIQTNPSDTKAKLPREWRWERPTVDLSGMIRNR